MHHLYQLSIKRKLRDMSSLMPVPLSGNGLGFMLLIVAICSTLLLDLHLHNCSRSCNCIDSPVYNVTVLTAESSHLQELPRNSEDRIFKGYGCAAHVYVEFGAYRAGNRSFAVVGLASKPLHTYGNPSFGCSWITATSEDQNNSTQLVVNGKSTIYYTDYDFGRVYKVVSVMCDFDVDIGIDGNGGQLILNAFLGDTTGHKERIVALTEKKGEYKWSNLVPPYPYEFLYCGSPLYGDLNPQRIREWVAYHALVFGNRSHFVFYDAGGINSAVRKVLRPWMKLGRLSIQNVRQQSEYDGYLYNQFLIIADCLHRYRFSAKWTLFFDIDEFMYFEPPKTAHDVFAQYSDNAQISFTQYRMSNNICAIQNGSDTSKLWAFERLAFNIATSQNFDVKMALNPRKVRSTGVHWAIEFSGRDSRCDASVARYYHYHNTVSDGESCMEAVDHTQRWNFSDANNDILTYDGSMIPFAEKAKHLEKQIFSPGDLAKLTSA